MQKKKNFHDKLFLHFYKNLLQISRTKYKILIYPTSPSNVINELPLELLEFQKSPSFTNK